MITLPHFLLAPQWRMNGIWLVFGAGEIWLFLATLPLLVVAFVVSLISGK